jgi:SOS response associated peptidase (SRAP)
MTLPASRNPIIRRRCADFNKDSDEHPNFRSRQSTPFTLGRTQPLRRTPRRRSSGRRLHRISRAPDAADPSDPPQLVPGPPPEARRARGACGHGHRRSRATRQPDRSRRSVAAVALRACSGGGRSHAEDVPSCAIITMPANELLAEIHNAKQRMPLILPPEAVDTWLTGTPE